VIVNNSKMTGNGGVAAVSKTK